MNNKQANIKNNTADMNEYIIKPTFAKDLNSYTAILRMNLQTSPGGATTLCSYRILST